MSETGRPGRYQRSGGGLLAALLITVVGVVAFLGFRALVRTDLEVEPESVDYLETVGLAQDAGVRPVYPASLPDGWIATGVEVEPGDEPAFGVRMLTDDEQFVGVRQAAESVTALLSTYVDEETAEEEPIEVDGSVASTWEGYSDDGDDLAYAAEVGEETVLVYGSASASDLRAVVESLTDEPVATPRESPSR